MQYEIMLRYHYWFDAGIVGLYFYISKLLPKKDYPNASIDFDSEKLTIQVDSEEELVKLLGDAYENLVGDYWNVSSKSQIENKELVFYDEKKDLIESMPKRNPTPIVSKFIKGTSWKKSAEGIKYDELETDLRARVDKFLEENNKKLWGSEKLLVTKPLTCHQVLETLPEENLKKQSSCSICGKMTSNLSEISQPSYLLFASKNAGMSFHTQGKAPAKICWECELLSKFTMDTISYKVEGETTSIVLLNSPNLEVNVNKQSKIGSRSINRRMDQDYFFRNIGVSEKELLSRAKYSYEMLFAYFYDSFMILKENISESSDTENPLSALLEDIVTSPLQIIIMMLKDGGQTFFTKEVIEYNDSSYAFRLIGRLTEEGIDLSKVFKSLYETDTKNNVMIYRNDILKKVMRKKCVLKELAKITEHRVLNNIKTNTKALLDFAREYYLIIKEEAMNREDISVATGLGKQIVMGANVNANEDDDVLKRVRKDLYTLRKTKTKREFISSLSNLQFRYGISVSSRIAEGMLEDVNFEDFKGYVIMAALNKYNHLSNKNKNTGKGEGKNE